MWWLGELDVKKTSVCVGIAVITALYSKQVTLCSVKTLTLWGRTIDHLGAWYKLIKNNCLDPLMKILSTSR